MKDYDSGFRNGSLVYERYSHEEQQGFTKGGRIHVEASLIVGRSYSTDENQDERADRQEAEVESYARQVGIWYENTHDFLKERGEYLDEGNESVVVYDEKRGMVTKSSNINQYRDLQDALDSITLHNTYFPESKITVLGFGMDREEYFQIITEQPFIVGTHNVTQEDIENFLIRVGYGINTSLPLIGRFKTSDVLMNDILPKNVIFTSQGNIVPIDTIMHLNTPVFNSGGTRIVRDMLHSVEDTSK